MDGGAQSGLLCRACENLWVPVMFFLADLVLFEIPGGSFGLGRLIWVLMLLLLAVPWWQVGPVFIHAF